MNRETIIQMAREAGLAEVTDTNQNLRQAEQALLKRYAELVNSGDAGNWYQEAELEVIAARQALALPTADHLPDAGEMVNGLTQAETDASASVSGLTAAPVCERERFEKWASREGYLTTFEPNAMCYKGLPVYKDPRTHAAWWAWQARAALSAGDAVDAQRYRWLREQNDDDFSFAVVKNPHFDVYESPEELDAAIDAAMRKDKL